VRAAHQVEPDTCGFHLTKGQKDFRSSVEQDAGEALVLLVAREEQLVACSFLNYESPETRQQS